MRKTLVMAMVVTAALQATAQQPATAGASIEGRAIDAATGRPIAGVRLTVGTPTLGGAALSAASDAEGHFLIRGLTPGSHRITTSKDGYAPAKPEMRKTPGPGLVFTVARDQQLKEVVIRLVPHGVITGTVFDMNNSPVLGASVLASQSSYDEFGEKAFSSAGSSSRTDDRGEFRIFGLSPGEYYIRVSGPGPGQALPFIAYVLYYPSGADLSRAQPVLVRSGEEISLAPMYTPVLETAPVRLNIVTDVPNLPGQSRTMQFGPKGASLSMTVSQSNQPNGGPNAIEHRGLPLGTNEVRVTLETPDGQAYGETTFELAQSTEKLNVDLILRKGVRFAARVVLEGANGVAEPVRGVELSIGAGARQLNGQTGPDGMLAFASTPPSQYRLTVSGLPEDAYIACLEQDGKSLLMPRFTVAGSTRLDIVARTGGGVVEGVAQDSQGKAIPGSLVALIPERSLRGEYYRYRSATSDQEGKFTLRNVVAGNYKLFAWIEASGPGPFRNAEFVAKYEDRGKEIQLAEGERTTANIQLADEEP